MKGINNSYQYKDSPTPERDLRDPLPTVTIPFKIIQKKLSLIILTEPNPK